MAQQMPNQNFEHYTRKGCVGCAPCQGGAKQIGRQTLFWITLSMAAWPMPFFKKCVYCGHNTYLNKHQPHTVAN